jgi:myosin heavy subunit
MYPGGVEAKVQMFTFIGPILIAVNPYQRLPIFTNDLIKVYYDQVHLPAVSIGGTSS